MKKANRFFSAFLAFMMLMASFPAFALEPNPGSESEVIARIGVLSDLHLTTENENLKEKFRSSLSALASTEGGLDSIVINGDMTNDGTVEEYQVFRSIFDDVIDTNQTKFTAVMGNHEFYAYGWGVNVDANEGLKETMQGWFTEEVGIGIEDEQVVNGVHILAVSPDNEMDSYQNREAFLEDRIQNAAAENPEAPIILVVHKPAKYTVLSSGTAPDGDCTGLAADWSDDFLEFIKNYPQIIYLSAHAHDDLGDNDNMYQEDYTCIQDGVVASNISTGLLIKVNSDYVVTIERKNFTEGTDFEPSWVIDIPAVAEDKSNFVYRKVNEVKNICLTPGEDQSSISINWLNSTVYTGTVEYLQASDMMNGTASNIQTVTSYESGTSKESDYYYNHALITGLLADTEYLYRVGNENGWSDYYSYKTGASSDSFSFLLMGDPQMGGGDGDPSDEAGWTQTVTNALDAFPETSFIVTPGNQVNIASSTSQYDSFFAPHDLRSIPLITAVGGHDYSSYAYSQYFSYPSATEYGQTSLTGEYGGDYSYLYNNTLIMVLNTNNKEIAEHRTFMQRTLLETGSQAKWKIVVFNHSIFGSGPYSQNSAAVSLREELAPVLSGLNVDMALMGNDHVYTRTYMMEDTTPVTENGVQSEVTDPAGGQVVYITANSASGSKYYNLTENPDYAAVQIQTNEPQFSHIRVTENSLTITTYSSDDLEEADTFTIYKTGDSSGDTIKPYLLFPVNNTIVVGESFNPLEGVTATDNNGVDLTDRISFVGSVDTDAEGTYTLTYSVTDDRGNEATAIRKIEVVDADELGDHSLYYGLDVTSGAMQDEEGTIPATDYYVPDSFTFVEDEILDQTVLQMPYEDCAEISGLDIQDLDDKYTIEMYIYIDRSIQNGDYEIFQFGNHNINLCALRDPITFFGAGTEVDVTREEFLPSNQWIHIICTAKEGEQVCYVNGVPFAKEYSDVLGTVTGPDADNTLYLGSSNTGRASKVKIASFRIYNGYSTANLVGKMYRSMLNTFMAADYTAVIGALSEIPADLTPYTSRSVAALNAAKDAVVCGKSKNEQQNVDDMAQAIQEAIASLRHKTQATYSVTVLTDGNGTASADKTVAEENETITLSASPYSGYTFKGWRIVSGNADIAGNTLTMSVGNVTVKALFKADHSASDRDISSEQTVITWSEIDWSSGNFEVKLSESDNISASVFRHLSKQNADNQLLVSGENCTFLFIAGSISSELDQGGYNFGVTFDSGDNLEPIKDIAESSLVKMIHFHHSGELPGEAQIRFSVGIEYAGKTLYYYYYNPATKKMEYQQSVIADPDGYVTVTQKHCSDYALTTVQLTEEAPKETSSGNADKNQSNNTGEISTETNPSIPDTGNKGNTWAWIVALLSLGVLILCYKKGITTSEKK